MMFRHLLLSCLTAKGVRERVYVGPVLLVFLFVSGGFWTETSAFSTPYNGTGTFYDGIMCMLYNIIIMIVM